MDNLMLLRRILVVVEASLRGEKTFGCSQDSSGDWCFLQHLCGCCLLDQVQCGACGALRERKIMDAIRCFFRAHQVKDLGRLCTACLKKQDFRLPQWIHYYEWAMQIFERYNISEGACQFAYAALEQVDEVYNYIERTEKADLIKTATNT